MPAPSKPAPAAPWALLWLAAIAAGSWFPLLLIDRQPRPAASPSLSSLRPAPAPISPVPVSLAATPLQAASTTAEPNSWPPAAAAPIASPRPTPPPRAISRPSDEPQPQPVAPGPVSGSVLLGGPLNLESLQERAMVPAARTEQALRAASPDRLQALPRHWRNDMQQLVEGTPHVRPAEVVRLPTPQVSQPEEIPLAVRSDGTAETTVQPSSPQAKQVIERWAERQPAIPQGEVRPVMVVLEPLN